MFFQETHILPNWVFDNMVYKSANLFSNPHKKMLSSDSSFFIILSIILLKLLTLWRLYDDNNKVELYFIMIIKSCTFDCHGANILVFRESSNLLSWKESVFNQFCISPLHPPLCVFAYLSATQCLSDGNAKLIYRQRKAYLSAMQSLSDGNAKLICRQRNSIASAMYLKIPERVKVKSFLK